MVQSVASGRMEGAKEEVKIYFLLYFLIYKIRRRLDYHARMNNVNGRSCKELGYSQGCLWLGPGTWRVSIAMG